MHKDDAADTNRAPTIIYTERTVSRWSKARFNLTRVASLSWKFWILGWLLIPFAYLLRLAPTESPLVTIYAILCMLFAIATWLWITLWPFTVLCSLLLIPLMIPALKRESANIHLERLEQKIRTASHEHKRRDAIAEAVAAAIAVKKEAKANCYKQLLSSDIHSAEEVDTIFNSYLLVKTTCSNGTKAESGGWAILTSDSLIFDSDDFIAAKAFSLVVPFTSIRLVSVSRGSWLEMDCIHLLLDSEDTVELRPTVRVTQLTINRDINEPVRKILERLVASADGNSASSIGPSVRDYLRRNVATLTNG